MSHPAHVLDGNERFLAGEILHRVTQKGKPYAVFCGRYVEWMPCDGPRYGRLKDDPARMALCVGVFDQRATLDDIAQALATASCN